MRTTTILSHSLVGLIVMASLANVPAHAQVAAAAVDTSIVRRLAQLPAELTLAEGSLRVMNLFRAQGEILWSAGDAPQELVVNRLVQLGDIGMVADFTRMRPDSSAVANLLPHELTHQVHGEGARDDPDHGTVLHRLISEGFASYVAWIYSAGNARVR